MSLSKLKRTSNIEKLTKAVDAASQKGSFKKDGDERLWQPEIDKDSGIGQAVIRFLPDQNLDNIPWVSLYSYGFKNEKTKKWYIENALSTMPGVNDPVGDLNRRLWNSGVESDKAVARSMKRKLSYYSNVLVISDPANPENEGKVFIFRYGAKIYEKIQNALKPEFATIKSLDPFNPYTGANFQLRIKLVKVDNKPMPNYDASTFDSPSALFDGDDKKIDALAKQLHDIQSIVSPDKFKTYSQLQARLLEVLGTGVVGSGIEVVEGGTAPAAPAAKPTAAPAARQTAKTADADLPWNDEEKAPTATSAPSAATEEGSQSLDDFLNSLGDD